MQSHFRLNAYHYLLCTYEHIIMVGGWRNYHDFNRIPFYLIDPTMSYTLQFFFSNMSSGFELHWIGVDYGLVLPH